ncbi:hypothetical protein GCM10009775_06120 [Microbacterium aoyamense]|uniref:Aminoglycoside phosphotransferase domain-containing protein n=1 Tax=Microbacterium aoyamense TaxID=344166 RepID=A0ABN2PDY4_9MICO|nr:phosphotransferase [Microbacterium aoyamense]
MDAAPPELALLVDALELDDDVVPALVSRELLGAGSIAGFHVPAADGSTLTYFVDSSRRVVTAETGILSGTPSEPEVRVWLHPADPHLPALAPVAFSHAAQSLLARLGFDDVGAPALVVYRAGRRAVLRVPTRLGDTWVKAVPPDRVVAIVETHERLADAGIPVPALRGWSAEGLIVWDAASGVPAASVAWEPGALLDEVDALRARIAQVPLEHRARTGLARRLVWYADRLEGVLPPDGAAIAAGVVERARATWEDGTPASIHGDLHFGQLFLDEEMRISSVIDVDTAGRGAPSEDAAAFAAHAISSAMLTPAPDDARVWELARQAFERWGDEGMRARTATHVLGHALGATEAGDAERGYRLLELADAVVRNADLA